MFGYVVVNKPEMKIKEFDVYHSYYCGLCRALKKQYGGKGQITLSYDMTFLAVLLSALYEPEETQKMERCVAHPMAKHRMIHNVYLDYVADMNLMLTYYKCLDDWEDERKVSRLAYAKTIQRSMRKLQNKYPEKSSLIADGIQKIGQMEQDDCRDIDQLAGAFGKIMGTICAITKDEWCQNLYKIGFCLGKFIYIIDAYEDVEEDLKKNRFNPFKENYQNEDFDEWVQQVLTMIAANMAREFEKLPILNHVEILRNILYAGIWTRFEAVKEGRQKK